MLSIVFDTQSGNNTVYIGPKATILRNILSVIVLVPTLFLCFGILVTFVGLMSSLGAWLGSVVNESLGTILTIVFALPALYLAFLGFVIAIAYVGLFVRVKILKTVGYFKNGYFLDPDNRTLECYKIDGTLIAKIDLKLYSTLVSNTVGEKGGIELYLKSLSGETIDISQTFNLDTHIFYPYCNRPGSRPNGRNDNLRNYPVDEFFALWNKIKLIKDGQEVPERFVVIF
jgi:hypothetical protein